jgi:hypothetical protein
MGLFDRLAKCHQVSSFFPCNVEEKNPRRRILQEPTKRLDNWSHRSLNHLGHFADPLHLVLVPFQLMSIFGDTVTMFWGKRLFSLLMYKRQFNHVTGDVPIEIVITLFRFIKHYLFCCLHLRCDQRSLDQRAGPALLIRCCVFLCMLFMSLCLLLQCVIYQFMLVVTVLFISLCLLLQCVILMSTFRKL